MRKHLRREGFCLYTNLFSEQYVIRGRYEFDTFPNLNLQFRGEQDEVLHPSLIKEYQNNKFNKLDIHCMLSVCKFNLLSFTCTIVSMTGDHDKKLFYLSEQKSSCLHLQRRPYQVRQCNNRQAGVRIIPSDLSLTD